MSQRTEMMMNPKEAYIPALRFHWLTPLFDLVLRFLMQEVTFKKALVRETLIQPGQQILDLGCGTATLSILIQQTHPDAVVTGLDIDPQVLQIGQAKAERAGVHLTLDQGLAYDLPYPDGSFDRVVSSLMFHHLTTQDKQQAMKEVYRVLRPGGLFLIVDFGPALGIWSQMVSPLMARLEEVSDNHKGLLPTMLSLAGFKDINTAAHFATVFGTLYLYRGQKTFR